jgi:hypothetical protein
MHVSWALTVREVDAEMSSIRQRIQAHQIPFRIFDLLSFKRQFLLRECPELPLRRLPVTGGHGGLLGFGSPLKAILYDFANVDPLW